MSGYLYTDSESYFESGDDEFDARKISADNSGFPPSAENSPERRVPPAAAAASPRKPPRPVSMQGGNDTRPDTQWSGNNITIEMDDPFLVDTLPSKSRLNQAKPDQSSTNRSKPHPVSVIYAKPDQPRSGQSRPDYSVRTKPDQTRSGQSKPDHSARTKPDQTSSVRSAPNRTRPDVSPSKAELTKQETSKAKRKNKVIAAIIMLVLLLIICIAVAIGASGGGGPSKSGVFAKLKGNTCDHKCSDTNRFPKPPLVVIALNGFRKELFQHEMLVTNLARLAECGVHGDTIPSYPSTAIPNLYALMTGIYPAYHGKASDWLRPLNDSYSADDPNSYARQDPRWFQLNGLWGIAADAGLLTASHSWIGSGGDVDLSPPLSPSYYQPYDRQVDYRSRIQTVLDWLHLEPSQRPDLITLYLEDPGHSSSKNGYSSKKVMDSVARVDSAIGFLLDTLLEENLLGCVNIMVVSTGGMADISCDRVYYLSDDLASLSSYQLLPDDLMTPVGRITPTERSPIELDTSEELFQHLQCKITGGQAFMKSNLPVHLHSSYGLQTEDVVVLMQHGWTFAKQQEGYDRRICKGKSDGFNPYDSDMQGLFVGFGKSFRSGLMMPPVKNVDLYNLMAALIEVAPRTNNGTVGILSSALQAPPTVDTVTMAYSPSRQSECAYPQTDLLYEQRQQMSETGCTCDERVLETKGVVIKDMDKKLRQTNTQSARDLNAPFGLAMVAGRHYCTLFQTNYVTSYDNKLRVPLMVAFTVRENMPRLTPTSGCVRYDVRLLPDNTPKCSSYRRDMNTQLDVDLEWAFLYDPSLADSMESEFNALVSSNIVPQYAAFKQYVWIPLAERIRQWSNHGNRSSQLNIAAGPVYDWNSDTKSDGYFDIASSRAWVEDSPVPSHYYIIAVRCLYESRLGVCPLESLETAAFVLPHSKYSSNCRTFNENLVTHRASIQDVELITGLRFFPDLSGRDDSSPDMTAFKAKMPSLSPWLV